jgi:hypothetical protein
VVKAALRRPLALFKRTERRLLLGALLAVTVVGNVVMHTVHYLEVRRTGRRN